MTDLGLSVLYLLFATAILTFAYGYVSGEAPSSLEAGAQLSSEQDTEVVSVAPGYYRLICPLFEEQGNTKKAMGASVANILTWYDYDEGDCAQLFSIQPHPTVKDCYTLQNVASGMYVCSVQRSQTCEVTKEVTEAAPIEFYQQADGFYGIADNHDPNDDYRFMHCRNHREGIGSNDDICGWEFKTEGTGASKWQIEAVSKDVVDGFAADIEEFRAAKSVNGVWYKLDKEAGTAKAYRPLGFNYEGDIVIRSEVNGCTVTTIAQDAFRGQGGLKSLTIPASVTSLEDGCFADNGELFYVAMESADPSSISIGENVFDGCNCFISVPAGSSVAYKALSPWNQMTVMEGGWLKPTPESAVPFSDIVPGQTEFYLYNVGAKEFLCAANNDTRVRLGAEALLLKANRNTRYYSLSTAGEAPTYLFREYWGTVYCDGGEGCSPRDICWTIGDANQASFTMIVPPSYYNDNLQSDRTYYFGKSEKKSTGDDLRFDESQLTDYARWQVVLPETYNACKEQRERYEAAIELWKAIWEAKNRGIDTESAEIVLADQNSSLEMLKAAKEQVSPTFVYNGLGYNIRDVEEQSLEVPHQLSFNTNPQGDIVIPSVILRNNQFYKVKYIGQQAFYCCGEITSLLLPNSVEELSGVQQFQHCGNLKTVKFNEGLKNMSHHMFCDCHSLESFNIPASVTQMDWPVVQCPNLKEITVASGSKDFCSVDGAVYSKNQERLFVVPRNAKYVSLPGTLKEIGENALEDCREVNVLVLPETVENVHAWSFSGMTGLKKIVLRGAIENFDGSAFNSTPSLKEVYMAAPTHVASEFKDFGNVTLFVPKGKLGLFEAEEYQQFKEIVEVGQLYFEDNAVLVDNCSAVKGRTVTVPVTVRSQKEVSEAGFAISLPEGVELEEIESKYENTKGQSYWSGNRLYHEYSFSCEGVPAGESIFGQPQAKNCRLCRKRQK